ncbi:anhydro-N-acetylmuramic acid kinase [Sporolactobacillus sp. THM19-2]|nr:anhydro-N-acetylmuramic acid kinase [Sporolactobacillus sp. THM19-2]
MAEQYIVWLISGTSVNGIDTALTRIEDPPSINDKTTGREGK